jgi:hypothetical protein
LGMSFAPAIRHLAPQASHVRRLRRVFPVYVSLTHIPLRNVENHGFSCKTVSRRLASENRLMGTANDGRGSDST